MIGKILFILLTFIFLINECVDAKSNVKDSTDLERLEFENDSAVDEYVKCVIDELMRARTRSDVGVLYDVAEKLREMKRLIIPDYTRMPPILNAAFSSPDVADAYNKKVKEGEVQSSLRKAWRTILFMLVTQTSNQLCGEESEFQANTIRAIAKKAGLSKYETDCFLQFREKKILPRDEQAFPIRTATVAEIVEFFRQIDERRMQAVLIRREESPMGND